MEVIQNPLFNNLVVKTPGSCPSLPQFQGSGELDAPGARRTYHPRCCAPRWAVELFWGAHAPRVLTEAPSPRSVRVTAHSRVVTPHAQPGRRGWRPQNARARARSFPTASSSLKNQLDETAENTKSAEKVGCRDRRTLGKLLGEMRSLANPNGSFSGKGSELVLSLESEDSAWSGERHGPDSTVRYVPRTSAAHRLLGSGNRANEQ